MFIHSSSLSQLKSIIHLVFFVNLVLPNLYTIFLSYRNLSLTIKTRLDEQIKIPPLSTNFDQGKIKHEKVVFLMFRTMKRKLMACRKDLRSRIFKTLTENRRIQAPKFEWIVNSSLLLLPLFFLVSDGFSPLIWTVPVSPLL